MPEASESAKRTVDLLFGHDPRRLESLAQNPVFAALIEGVAGIHELGALAQLAELSTSFDALVVDTAPTRHALELLRLPERVGSLVDSRALRFLADVSRRRLRELQQPASRPERARWFDWGESRLVAELEASLGGAPVAACMELVAAGLDARPALSRIAGKARELLTGKATRYVLVTSPREGAVSDVAFFHDGLTELAHPPSWLVLNRTLGELPTWPARVSGHARASEPLRHAARMAAQELEGLVQQSRDTHAALTARFAAMSVACVPRLDATVPKEVVRALALSLADVTGHEQSARAAHHTRSGAR